MTYNLQDHIHLSLAIGGTPEYAPNQTWKVLNRSSIPQVILSFERSLSGKPLLSYLASGGLPIQFSTYKYQIYLVPTDADDLETRAARLKLMQGRYVYLCDSLHPDNGADHRPATRTMILTSLGEFPLFNPNIIRYVVEIGLEDADTA